MMNCNHKNIVYVPACMLCRGYQAVTDETKTRWSNEFKRVLFSKNIDIVQLPCPEFSFFRKLGIVRTPKGIKYYESLEGFNEFCDVLSKDIFNEILFFQSSGYKIVAIVGIEHSPTCAVNYMYTNIGTIHRKGIFFNKIYEQLETHDMEIPFIGINRNFYKKAICEIEKLFNV